MNQISARYHKIYPLYIIDYTHIIWVAFEEIAPRLPQKHFLRNAAAASERPTILLVACR
jgi:hypothetical protein